MKKDDPYWCKLCNIAHPVRSISDGHNKRYEEQEDEA